VELQFQAAPSAYLGSLALAFLSILLGFGIGYMVSAVGGLELVPGSRAGTAPSDAAERAAGPPPDGAGTAKAAHAGKHAQGTRPEVQESDAEHARQGTQEGET